MRRLRVGDFVRIRVEGSNDEWCPAHVDLATGGDPQAIGLLLDGILRGTDDLIGGALPLLLDFNDEICNNEICTNINGLMGGPYEIELEEGRV